MRNAIHEGFQSLIRLSREWPFTLAAVLTLALGTGVILAASWIFYATFLKPLPYPQGGRLVSVSLTMPGNSGIPRPMSQVAYLRFRRGAAALAASAFYERHGYNLDLGGQAARIHGVETTGSLFATLQVKPFLGRIFGDRADAPGAPRIVVLGNRFWREDFGARPDVLGQRLELNHTAYTVIGVMPRGFRFPARGVDFWTPYPLIAYNDHYFQLTAFGGHLIGRLATGQSLGRLDAQVRTLTAGLIHRFPPSVWKLFRHFSAQAESWRTSRTGHLRVMLTLIEISSCLLLGLVWFNLANLFTARGVTQRSEVLLRTVLGAGSGDFLVRYALEAAWIGLLATLSGEILAQGLLAWVRSLRVLPEVTGLSRNLPFTATLILAVGGGSILIMTLVPLISGRVRDLGTGLRESGSRTGASRATARARRTLVTVQVALATTLAGVALLLAQTLFNLSRVQPGFQTRHVIAFDVDLQAHGAPPQNPWTPLQRLGKTIRQIPGIQDAGISSGLPFGLGGSDVEAFYPLPWHGQGSGSVAYIRLADRGYLNTLGLDPFRGRLFGPGDAGSKAGVAVIDRLAAHALYGNRNPIGRIFTLNSPDNTNPALRFRVVGLVPTVRNKHLGRPPKTGTVYLDAPQALALAGHSGWYDFSRWVFVVRSPLGSATLRAELRQTVHAVLPGLPPYHFRTLAARLNRRLRTRNTLLGLVSLFAIGALLLTAVGLYGVESFLVNRRLREFGIRAALGADRTTLIRLVLGESGRIFAIGMVAGLAGMVLLGHLFATMLYGIRSMDPMSFLPVALLMGIVLILAAWGPARKASRVSPALALRQE
jgi:predicted permease